MKHFVPRLLALVCAAGGVLMAQSSTPQVVTSYGGYGAGVVLPGFLPPTPGAMEPVAFWTAYLNLDAGQQASVKTILSDQQSSSSALKTNLDQARSALNATTKTNGVDSEIDRLSANLGAVVAQTLAVQAKAYARFYALLTPDQKQKFDSLPTGIAVFGSGGAPGGTSVKQ
ncbi:MAG TPA: Spy/CpxP family protein refolding chaperone [Bryobacteraceae bacterium]|nr:Spy/CpxP family protein refolding chaperone [Bryobacteraceae bacterium]